MKKYLYFLLFFSTSSKLAAAQTLNIAGTIKDENNKPISLVSVIIEKEKSGIATDSSGNFQLNVPKYSRINLSAIGFEDTVLIIENNAPLNIVLRHTERNLDTVTVTNARRNYQVNNQLKNQMLQSELTHYKTENNLSSGGADVYTGVRVVDNGGSLRGVPYHVVTNAPSSNIYQGSAIPEFRTKEDTKGSLYLFDNWMKGVVSNAGDHSLIDDPKNNYNINKITGELVLTRDFNSALYIDKNKVQFLILFDSINNKHTLMIVPVINSDVFCEVIAMGDNYDIFKLTTTKFVKANFRSDGMVSSGNNYDEYVDTKSYYLLDVKNNNVTKFELKKKSLKQAFNNVSKANDYLNSQKSDEINDAYLKGLAEGIN